jgi:hypothetical protein
MLAHSLAYCFVNPFDEFSPGPGAGLGCSRTLFVHFGESTFHLFTRSAAGEATLWSTALEAALWSGALMLPHPLAHFFVHLLDEFFPGLGAGLRAGFGAGLGAGFECFCPLLTHFGESAFHLFTWSSAGEASLRSAPEEAASWPTTLEAALRTVSLGRLGFGCVLLSMVGPFNLLVLVMVTPAAASARGLRKRPCRRQGDC